MIRVEVNNEIYSFDNLVTIKDIVKKYPDYKEIVGGVYNGKLHDLNYYLKEDGKLEFIYKNSETGRLMEERTLSFLLISAVKQLYPLAEIHIEHSLSSCLFCRFENIDITKEINHIRKKMQEMVEAKRKINRSIVTSEEAVAFFEKLKMNDKADLLRYRRSDKSSIYELEGIYDYFYGVMFDDLSYLGEFYLHPYRNGVLLGTSAEYVDQKKLYDVFCEYESWGKKIGVSTVAELNKKIADHQYTDLILISEAVIDKNLSMTINKILHAQEEKKVVLIAGPSSAGKTTFSKRLGIYLKVEGYEPVVLSMDDFFKNRENTPKLSDGSYDFENIETVDLALFNETVNRLLNGEEVLLPYFDFVNGTRKWHHETTKLAEKDILIVEGIHALNPRSSEMIDECAKFKIYINALTHLNYDSHNRIPTSDYRMIRRMVRDYQFRGCSAKKTIESWPKVEAGEQKYIYPYQEEADVIFNTSMVYEMAVLKKIAIPLLDDIKIGEKEYLEANRLKKLLAYFLDGDETYVPQNSILAEFIGNSVFFQ